MFSRMRRSSLVRATAVAVAAALGVACGHASAPAAPTTPAPEHAEAIPPSATGAPSSAAPPGAATATAAIPTTCTGKDGACTPDPAFVKRLCNAWYPDVALVLMNKETPFTRMYLRGDVDGWNADGGASAPARLGLDEEVLLLKRHVQGPNGIVVGGGNTMLVMRWDGNCYTLDEGEVTAKRPRSPRSGPIPWRRYEDATRDALLASPKVLAAHQRRGKECKGAISGEVSRACEAADDALSAAVVAEVRGGASIPRPAHVP